MDDLISRQAAIDALHMHLMYRMGTDSNKKRLDEWINNLPSAQPEQRWIPCSERLPSENGKYIVTEKRYAVDDRNHDGKYTVIVEEVNWWGKWERAKFYEVTAWMPLPEPYKEGGEQE